jgi:hypothetical protein
MVTLNKFQKIHERLMTDAEIRSKAKEMNLEGEAVKVIISQFDYARDAIKDGEQGDKDSFSAGDGRLVDVCSEMIKELLEDAMIDPREERIEKVYLAFFGPFRT